MAHPMDTLVTAQPELVRKQPLLGICFSVPLFEKWMNALSQGGLPHLWPCALHVEAARATTLPCSATADHCLPFVATD